MYLGHFNLFADDTYIFCSGKTKIEAYKHANLVLNDVNSSKISSGFRP